MSGFTVMPGAAEVKREASLPVEGRREAKQGALPSAVEVRPGVSPSEEEAPPGGLQSEGEAQAVTAAQPTRSRPLGRSTALRRCTQRRRRSASAVRASSRFVTTHATRAAPRISATAACSPSLSSRLQAMPVRCRLMINGACQSARVPGNAESEPVFGFRSSGAATSQRKAWVSACDDVINTHGCFCSSDGRCVHGWS